MEEKKLRILIVEDVASDVELLIRQLKRDGLEFEYLNVAARKEYVNALHEFAPSIILSDHSLPQFNSWEALRIAHEYDPHLPFILVTGTVSEEFAVDILHAGADDYILKSSLKRLSSALNNAVQRKQSEREREEMLQQLKKSEARLAAFTENSPVLQWITNPEGKFVFLNKALEQAFAIPVGSLEKIGPADLVEPGVAQVLNGLNTEVRSTGEPKETVIKTRTEKGDRYYLVSKFLMPHDHLGGIAIDLTAQKLAEEKLKNLNEELNTFIYKASHDLKGPLSSIMGIANLTRTEQFDSKAKRYIDMIAESTHKLDKILLGLIEVMSVKQAQVKTTRIDFKQLIDEVFKLLEYSPGFSRLKFNVKVDVKRTFYSDRNVLVSVVQNMVENAVKYQDMSQPAPRLNITVTDHKEGVMMEFRDNGVGIHHEVINKVFDMFFRGNEESKGSGLGLYIVRNAVEKLGGSINVESRNGDGCRFTVYLPAAQPVNPGS